MELLSAFQQNLQQQFLLHQQQGKLLLAVSGGADSVVMTDLFHRSGYDFVIAHCNFQLREEESDRDEDFVRSLGEKYNKPVFVQRFDTRSMVEEQKISVQEAARVLRYDWFEKLRIQEHLKYIVTAHHANDNAETVLMHLFRGTGLKGLTGIPENQNHIIRPLLKFDKEELLEYAKVNGLRFVEDSSNASDKYTRNFFRLELIPAVKKVFPNAQANIVATIDRLKETSMIFDEAIAIKRKKIFSKTSAGNDETVAVAELKRLNPFRTWIWELFRVYGISSAQVAELIKLMDADNGSYLKTPSHRIIKNRNRLLITSVVDVQNITAITIDKDEKLIQYPGGELILENLSADNFKINTSANICSIDASEIRFPLLLRKWKQGDYFYPLGMKKKKKLSRFFIDRKLSLLEKENIWVLESNKRIVWIVNHRMDDRFKILPSTKKILKIELRIL